MSFKDPDPRKDPNFKNLDVDEKYDLMEKFMEAKDQAFEQIFNEQKKEVEEAKSEAKEAKAAQAAAEPLPRIEGVFEKNAPAIIFAPRLSRRSSFFAPSHTPQLTKRPGLFGSGTTGLTPPSSGRTFPTITFSAGGGGPSSGAAPGVASQDIAAIIASTMAALGPILGAAMEQQHLPIV